MAITTIGNPMKRSFLFILLLAVIIKASAQAPAIQWQKSLGGSNDDEAFSIQQTSDGGYIVAGWSSSDDGEVSGNHGIYDYWIVKLNDTGAIQWEKSLGGTTGDLANSIQQTSDGGYIVAGWSSSNNDNVSGNHGGYDYWVVKLNDTGAIQWEKSLGGSGEDFGYSVRQTIDSGYIVAGYTVSDDGDVTGNHGEGDYWIVKLNDTGAIQWQKALGGSGDDHAYFIQQTSDSGYIVAGSSQSNDGDVSGNHGGNDYWVVKLNDTGAIQWQKCLGGSGDDYAYAIRQTSDSGFVVAGWSNSNDSDVSGNHGGYDYWVVKLSDAGAIQWQRSLGGSSNDGAYSIEQTSDGGYVVAGESNSNDSEVSGNHGSTDYWVVKLNDSGAIQWQESLGGSLTDEAHAIRQTADGGYIIAGSSNSNDSEVSGNHGSDDYWLVKLACWINTGTITGNSTVCTDSSATLTDTVTGGVWTVTNHNATISGGHITGVTAGADTAIYTISNACGIAAETFALTIIHCPTAVNQISPAATIAIIPNPTSGNISITSIGNTTIKVYNTVGQLIKEADNSDNISISAFPPGLYFVRVFNEQGVLIKQDKIIKE